MTDYDILIKNASIVDGSGNKAYNGSVGVKDGRIRAIGGIGGDADTVIDASGLTLAPGFIDSHSHAETGLLYYPQCESFVFQGVTSFVGGQCGMSPGPIGDEIGFPGAAREHLDKLVKYKFYAEKSIFPRETVNEIMEQEYGFTVDWYNMVDYFKVVEERKFTVNYVPLLGHNTVRRYVMGQDYQRHATRPEIDSMSELIHQGMKDKCIGLSVGLDYDPDVFASREEIVEHVSIINEYGGVFCPHSRRTGRRRGISAGHKQHDKIDGILEILDIIRQSKVRTNIAHLFTGWYVTPQGAPDILEQTNKRATLTYIDAALEEGLDISFDVIPPSLPTKFTSHTYLCGLLQPWIRELGSRAALADWLKVKDFRAEIKDAIRRGRWFIRVAYNPNTNPRWAENITVLQHKVGAYDNKSLQTIAGELGKDPFDVWLDLIAEDPDSKCALGAGTDQYAPSHAIFFQHPQSSVGLDTGVDDYKHEGTSQTWCPPGMSSYSAFVGFFDKFVNKMKALTVEEAVYKTSTQTAKRHNIKDRGVIQEGAYADLVVLDVPNMKVKGTALYPRIKPEGIEYVIINGELVVDKGTHTGARPGMVLLRE